RPLEDLDSEDVVMSFWNPVDLFRQNIRQNIVQLFNIASYNESLFGKLLSHFRKYKKLLPKELRENLKLFYIIPNSVPESEILPPRILHASKIINPNQAALIASWIDHKDGSTYYLPKEIPYSFKLLLRGSRDGFSVEDFRKRCFNQGATVIIIKTKMQSTATPSTSSFQRQTRTGQIIIGGYNPESWLGTNKFVSSTESFIFSLCSDTKTQIVSRATTCRAISDDNDLNIGFGCGDLSIFKKSCRKNDYMYEILDRTEFTMNEIEVFQVVKKED
ncbi:12962_t:CDS:2, partial [Dentiscutata erythropus]